MAGVPLPEMSPWKPRSLTIPPNSIQAWLRLAVWELWMGMLVCVTLGLGVHLIVTSPSRIVAVADLTNCYGPLPVAVPCERILYRRGALDAAFTVLCGLMLIGVAVWFLWELWTAVEPKPITDDFLRLLNDSFGSDWRNPMKWPWTRLLFAYGFTGIGAIATAAIGIAIWTMVVSSEPAKTPTVQVETSQSFRLGQ
jgi:hypothetical protein